VGDLLGVDLELRDEQRRRLVEEVQLLPEVVAQVVPGDRQRDDVRVLAGEEEPPDDPRLEPALARTLARLQRDADLRVEPFSVQPLRDLRP
jgi:hypothetical protein